MNRTGIRLYLSVGPGGAPASDFAIESIAGGRADNGAPLVSAEIHNTGGRALDLSGELRLTDGPGGLSAGPFPADLGTTLGIDQTEPLTVALDKQLPDGPWKATLTVKSGQTERTASATITFPESGMGPAVTPDADGLAWWIYAAGAAALLLLPLLVWWLLARRRRRHSNTPAPGPGDPALVNA